MQEAITTTCWRGLLAFLLLGAVGVCGGPEIIPTSYYPNLSHYIPRYVLLALSIGFAMSAIRSRPRINRLSGIAVLIVGGFLVTFIIIECLQLLEVV